MQNYETSRRGKILHDLSFNVECLDTTKAHNPWKKKIGK